MVTTGEVSSTEKIISGRTIVGNPRIQGKERNSVLTGESSAVVIIVEYLPSFTSSLANNYVFYEDLH